MTIPTRSLLGRGIIAGVYIVPCELAKLEGHEDGKRR